MPKGIYVRTEKTRHTLSEAMKDRPCSKETRRKLSSLRLGTKHPHSEETKRKISLANMGKKHPLSEKTKRKISNANKENAKHNVNYGMKGKHPTNETLKKMSEAQKGKPWTKEHIKNFRKYREKQIFPRFDTSIEIKIQNFLIQLGIEFFTHKYMNIKHGYQCDIFIPSMNLVIECDGDYWHSYPTGKEIDHIRTQELIEKGFKVLRLWERNINNMNLNDFKEQIQ